MRHLSMKQSWFRSKSLCRGWIGAGLIITPATQIAQENTDVLAALTSLGYSVTEASRAVATLPADSDLSVEERVKLALQYLGG